MTLPDDPYKALGVAPDATAAAIKTAYRKLVLKCHPDKVTDDSLKNSAADQFHKIQTAWETVGDEEKRVRYDAQARLSALRQEVVAREGQPGMRRAYTDMKPSAPYRSATADPRAPPSRSYTDFRVEEIRPHDADYFDRTRPDRREFDFGHDSRPKRTPPKEDRHRPRATRENTKESERARQREKVRQTTKATARDRDYKYGHAQVESDHEDDDYYTSRPRRSPREEDAEIMSKRERYFEQARREQEAASTARYDEKRNKFAEARDYIERTKSSRYDAPRRPSPNRMSSSREHIEIKRADGRPVTVRHGSGRSRTVRDEPETPSRRRRDEERDMRSSSEFEDPYRRPPGLSQAKSAPDGIHIPTTEKQRSYSVQHEADDLSFIAPKVKRADSLPQQSRRDDRGRSGRSSLRQTQIQDDYEMRKQASSYPGLGIRKEYADDHEYPTPEGYRVEVREPSSQKHRTITRSPSPIRDRDRERNRGSSSRHASPQLPPLNTRTSSTQYMYTPNAGVEQVSRPKLTREGSSRGKDSLLYGEVPTTRSQRDREPMSAPIDGIQYRNIRPDNVKIQSGYSASSRRPANDGRSPSYYRSSSYANANPVSA